MRTMTVRRVGIVATLAALTAASGGVLASAEPVSAQPEQKTLGGQGYKSLELGMTERQAKETGLLTSPETIGSCTWYRLLPSEGPQNPGNGVVVSPDRGVVAIQGTEWMSTPQGITMGSVDNAGGSTTEQIEAAYPEYRVDNSGALPMYEANIPGGKQAYGDAHYRFVIGEDGKVKDMSLMSDDTAGCISG